MQKIRKIVVSIVFVLLFVGNIAFAQNGITVKLDGEPISFDVPPQIINGRTMVPMRAIFENLGATVEWEADIERIISKKGDTTIILNIGIPIMVINDDAELLDTAPCIVDGRTLVPVRAISEAFNLNVYWDDETYTVLINSDDTFTDEYIPKYITDFSVEYQEENEQFRIFFGFKDENYQYVKYNGVAKINIKNEDGENVYNGEFAVDESMFGTYTRTITGNTQYILCEIDIPVSDIQKGKKEKGTVTLDFSNNLTTYEQLKNKCYNLPLLTGDDLADISYDSSFTLTKDLPSGGLWRRIKINSFEITNVELSYSGELKVSCKVTGTVDGDDYCSFNVKCYDEEGFVVGTEFIHEQVFEGEIFRFTETLYIPQETVKIEFVAH